MCAAEFHGQLVTALTFGCVFPLCVIFKVVFFTTRCVENKSCSRQKGDITEPLLQRKTFVKKYICNFHPFFLLQSLGTKYYCGITIVRLRHPSYHFTSFM